MKKMVILLFSVITIVIISYSFIVVQGMNNEFETIKKEFPQIIENEVNLSHYGNDAYEFEYYIDDVIITGEKLPHLFHIKDETHELHIKIKHGLIEKDYYMDVVDSGIDNQSKINILSNMFYEARIKLEKPLKGNTLLPFENDDNVSYHSSCMKLMNDVIVYEFNEDVKKCQLFMSIELDEIVYSDIIPVEFEMVSKLKELPTIKIHTDDSKEIEKDKEYVHGSLSLDNSSYLRFNEMKSKEINIRVRGNSSSAMPKKSYKIKFAEKQRFFSDYKEKEWVLLANFTDQTLMRNALAFEYAERFNFEFVPSQQLVDVYLNDEYQGVYLLTDQIDVTNDRVNIEEHTDNIDTGFLVEYDIAITRNKEVLNATNHFVSHGRTFVIKSPNDKNKELVEKQNKFINEYFDLVLDTLKAGEDYSNLIDDSTFVDWYIVNETFKNSDVGFSSIFLTKDRGGKLKMGPVWDFDLSSGNAGQAGEGNSVDGFRTQYRNYIFDLLFRYPDFREKIKNRWNELYDEVIINLPYKVYETSNTMTLSRRHNFERWKIIGINNRWYTADEVYQRKTYEEQEYYLYEYLRDRIKWLNKEINEF